MAKTRDYMDYLDDNVTIAPATSQEEYQAAETIANVLRDHNLETRVEEFDAHPWSRTIPPVLVFVMIVCLVVAKVIDGPVRFVALLLSALPVALFLISHFSGLSLYENLGPGSTSQNVVAVHRAVGDKVVKGARPIVIVAHYDTPRQSVLRQGPLARYMAALRTVSIPCYIAIAISILVQAIVVLPEAVRTAMWVIGLIAAFPLLVLAIADLYESFAPCTQGANDNKSSVAALLSIASKVRPVPDRVDERGTDDAQARVSRRRANDAFEDQPAPQVIRIVEEVKGVRHGADVLSALGILPPTCEVVYEEPRVQVVEQVATEVISARGAEDVMDEAFDEPQYESGREELEVPYLDEEVQDDYEGDVPVRDEAQEEDYEEENGDEYEEEPYEEESYEDELTGEGEDEEEDEDESDEEEEGYDEEDEEYEDDDDEDYEEQGISLEAIGLWFSQRLSGVKEFFERNRASFSKAERGEDDADEYDEYLDEYESWDDDDEDSYEEDFDEEFEDDSVVEESDEEGTEEHLEEDVEDEAEEEAVAEEYADEEDEEVEDDEDVVDDEQSADEDFDDDGAEEEESAEDSSEEQTELEESTDDSEEEAYDEEDLVEEDEDEPEIVVYEDADEGEDEEEPEGEFEEEYDEEYFAEEGLSEEEYEGEDYEEEEGYDDYDDYDEEEAEEYTEEGYEEEAYEDNVYDHEQGVSLTIGERISKLFRKIRISDPLAEDTTGGEIGVWKESEEPSEHEEGYEEEEGYAGVFEDAYDEDDLYEAYEDDLDFDDEEGYEEEDIEEEGHDELDYDEEGLEEEDYDEEEFGYEEFYEDDYDELDYDEDIDEPYYEEEDSEDSDFDFVEEPEDTEEDVKLPDPDMLHFDHEFDADIAPKDITGMDVISDSYDLFTDGAVRVQTYQKPEPVSDPSWGVSSYQPPVPSMNIARRAALFDLPDPSAASIDPFEDEYEEYDDEYDEYEETSHDMPSMDEPIDEPEIEDSDDTDVDEGQQSFWGKGDWKGGAAIRDDLRDVDEAIVIDADDLQDAILELGDDYLVAHDIWFVATGSSEYDHAGIKAFMEEHRKDIRGAFLVNLDCVGAGGLSIIVREGLHAPRRADRRLVRMISGIAQDLHIQLDTAMFNWGECESATSMRSRIRSVTIAGLDENNLPALSHSANDLPENVDPKQVSDVVRIVTELIRRA